MTDHELRMAMKDALDPYAQVQICADLCGCTREERENRLLDLGIDFPKKRGRKPGPKPAETKAETAPAPTKTPVVTLSKEEAESLYNHMMFSILDEIKADPETYDNIEYLVNLVHIYERCKEVSKC